MTVSSTPPHILVANNPYGHHLLASQLLEPYGALDMDRSVIVLCNGIATELKQSYDVRSFARFRIGALNYLFLVFMLIRLRWAHPKATYHLRGFVVGFLFFLSRFGFLRNARYIFDPRGAFPLEWVEAGKPSWISAIFRAVEARLIRNSFATIVTTKRFAALYHDLYGDSEKLRVIYNSTSFLYRERQGISAEHDRIAIAYLGTFNYWHDMDELYRVIESLTQQLAPKVVDVRIYTSDKFHDKVRARFADLKCGSLTVDYVSYADIPDALSDVQIGVSVVRPSASTKIASPIKVSDYIANGLIPLMNADIGDFDAHFKAHASAVLYDFGAPLSVPDLTAIDPTKNAEIYRQVSKQEAVARLQDLVTGICHV